MPPLRRNYEPCFLEWLLDVLNRKRSPSNAYWLDEMAKIFAVRWVHRKSSVWTEDCAQLFLLWKVEKGRNWRTPATDNMNYKSLKTNFRMNLRSKDFTELTGTYKKQHFVSPVRIFQVKGKDTITNMDHGLRTNGFGCENMARLKEEYPNSYCSYNDFVIGLNTLPTEAQDSEDWDELEPTLTTQPSAKSWQEQCEKHGNLTGLEVMSNHAESTPEFLAAQIDFISNNPFTKYAEDGKTQLPWEAAQPHGYFLDTSACATPFQETAVLRHRFPSIPHESRDVIGECSTRWENDFETELDLLSSLYDFDSYT